jgi:hypothetical protein
LADALRTLVPLSPSLALCLHFMVSTSFTESISASKYPRGYAAYRSRVAMFVPFLTPVWGALLSLTGGKHDVEELVWGLGAREAEEAKEQGQGRTNKNMSAPTHCITKLNSTDLYNALLITQQESI